MAEADWEAAHIKGMEFVTVNKTTHARMPGSKDSYCLTSGHSGTSILHVPMANFVMLAQQGYGVEHLEIKSVSDFNLLRFLKLKAFLWDVSSTVSGSSMEDAHDVLSFYLPFSKNHRSFMDLDLLRRICQLRRIVGDEL